MSFRGLPFVELQIGKLRQTTPTLWWKTPYTRILGGVMGRTCTRVHFENNGGKHPYLPAGGVESRFGRRGLATVKKSAPPPPGLTCRDFKEEICGHSNKMMEIH